MNILFNSIQAQIRILRELNERRLWGFKEKDFRRIKEEEVIWPPENRLVAPVVVPYLYDLDKTFYELIHRNDNIFTYYGLFRCLFLSLRKGVVWPGQTLRIEMIDFGFCLGERAAGDDESPRHVLKKERKFEVVRNEQFPHCAILAACFLHPRWFQSMDGEEIPYVWIRGLEERSTCVTHNFYIFREDSGRLILHDDDYWDRAKRNHSTPIIV